MAKIKFWVFTLAILVTFQFTSAADSAPTSAAAAAAGATTSAASTTQPAQAAQPVQPAQPPKPASQIIEGTCKGKEFCLTVLVAPWCPVCNNTIPTFKALNLQLSKLRPNMGFVIVVGEDNMENLHRKKNELLPIETYTDSDGSFFRNRKTQGFPTWIIYDKDGQEIRRKVGGQNRTSTAELEDLLKNFLGT